MNTLRIHSLTLDRFRGAHSLALELHRRLNIFVGMNGAGKSTLLDAAAILLSWLVNRIKHTGASGRPISEADIRNGQASATLAIKLAQDSHNFGWHIVKTRKGYYKKEGSSVLTAASEAAKRIQSDISDHNGAVNLPLFAYYPVNRAVLDIPLRIRAKHRFDLLSAYEDSLTSGASFRTFFEWFREREDLENEAFRDQHTLFKGSAANRVFPDAQLEAVRYAIKQLMPEFSQLTVRRNPLRMEVEKNGQRLTVNQLSDGEKCFMAMVGDMARRMAIANPLRDQPLHGAGVFLIDEIDLHLHPQWQRQIIPKLTKVFPNSQFLISTHSPHVITHVQPENLFLLHMTTEGLEVMRPSESYGKTVDRVLEDLMGLDTTRPTQVSANLQQIYAQIDRGLLNDARDLIDQLREQIGEDPELVKADILIKRKELIGK